MTVSARRSARLLSSLLVVAALAAACGGSLTDDEVLAASGTSAGTPAATGSTPTAGSVGTGSSVPVGEVSPSGGSAPVNGVPPVTTPGTPTTIAAASAAPSTPGQTGPIVIGSVGNYSGPAGSAQAGIPRGVQVWAASVNARGGLFGRPVQVVVIDDGGDPARYASALRDLVENRGAVAFVGNGASLSMAGGTSYLEGAKVPVIGSDCSLHEWFRSYVYFPQCPTYSAQLAAIVPSGVRLSGKKRFGYVACIESGSCRAQGTDVQDGVRAAGAQLVYSETISLTQIDFTAQCRNAQAAGVDLMLVGADPNTLARFARSCDRQGFHPQYIQASISITAASVSLPGLSRMAVSLPVFPFQGGSSPAIRAFSDAMARFSGAPPGPADAFGWAAGKLFEAIATRAAVTARSITPASLLAAGHTISGETLGGLTVPLTFTGPRPTPKPCYFAAQGDGNGGWSAPLGSEAIC